MQHLPNFGILFYRGGCRFYDIDGLVLLLDKNTHLQMIETSGGAVQSAERTSLKSCASSVRVLSIFLMSS